MIKHISFDLWLTLIKSHPEFKKKRADFLRKEFNPLGFTLEEVIEIVQNTDKVSDRINEINGKKLQTELMYKRILLKLGNRAEIINDDLLVEIKKIVNKLFMNYQPEFLNSSIHSMLNTLKTKGFDLNISSNTGFIEGNIITPTLKNLNIYDYFNFLVYSDEINASKPSFDFFNKVYEQINLQKNVVLHIGDNYKADYEGALNYGFKALHIKNKQYTINDITRYL
jgi:putative hydrolase of the HAD superfamily